MSPNCAENIVRYLHMKKLLGILVLGLLTCNISLADSLRVVDGDTIVLNGEKIRFTGIDTPELKDKIIFGMSGYGGNMILIDVENSRILVINSLHYNSKQYRYNHKKLILDPIKNGKQIN